MNSTTNILSSEPPRPSSSLVFNHDCLIRIFENLSMNEKLKCRLVCLKWKYSIDKMICGQKNLEICAVHSSIATAAVQATGIFSDTTTSRRRIEKTNCFVDSLIDGIRHTWTRLNGKLSARASAVAAFQNNRQQHSEASNNHLPVDDDGNRSISFQNPLLSSPYWEYAFCASSSLFSSYSFAQSSTTKHAYYHSFCDCSQKKYSIILDRHRITFEMFDIILRKFSNVNYLVIRNIDQLSDVLFFMIIQHCRKVKTLCFTSCSSAESENFSKKNHQSGGQQVPAFKSLTDYSWRLLNRQYLNLTSLTLRQCKLTEEQLTKIIQNCSRLCFLDISDNLQVGKSVRYLGSDIECLICGDLTNNESIGTILANIAFGNGRNLKYLSLFGVLGSLKAFNEFHRLTQLELHFYTEDESSPYLADIGMISLTSLVLEQIRCYESPSAVNHAHFEQMLENSPNLQRLQITGDFDWNLRLNDDSMLALARTCPKLKELTLNGNGSLTDTGLLHLTALPLTQLNLASFYSITDYSITTLIKRNRTLSHITLVDMPQITERTIVKTISVCMLNTEREIKMTFSDERIGKSIENLSENFPPNLKINFDQHLCGHQMAQSEPTDIQMLLVILMSAVILGMTILTTVVVVLVPLSMLMVMVHEWIFENFFFQFYPIIMEFFSSSHVIFSIT